eukprot:4096635-Pleurochrysis_carterae.AAC.2
MGRLYLQTGSRGIPMMSFQAVTQLENVPTIAQLLKGNGKAIQNRLSSGCNGLICVCLSRITRGDDPKHIHISHLPELVHSLTFHSRNGDSGDGGACGGRTEALALVDLVGTARRLVRVLHVTPPRRVAHDERRRRLLYAHDRGGASG